jgi:hypothetical protein
MLAAKTGIEFWLATASTVCTKLYYQPSRAGFEPPLLGKVWPTDSIRLAVSPISANNAYRKGADRYCKRRINRTKSRDSTLKFFGLVFTEMVGFEPIDSRYSDRTQLNRFQAFNGWQRRISLEIWTGATKAVMLNIHWQAMSVWIPHWRITVVLTVIEPVSWFRVELALR